MIIAVTVITLVMKAKRIKVLINVDIVYKSFTVDYDNSCNNYF